MILLKNDIQLTSLTTDKLIVIGDIHGLTKWRNVVEQHPNASRYVFLGDYCDPYGSQVTGERVIKNLRDIIEFKKKYPERVVLLLGNHDQHYLLPDIPKGSRYDASISETVYALFKDNESLFQAAYEERQLLFTHAGVLRSWLEELTDSCDSIEERIDINRAPIAEENTSNRVPIAEEITNHRLSIAEQINTCSNQSLLLQCGFMRGGYCPYGGIYWADINEFTLDQLLPGHIQIVGHNRVSTIQVLGESIDTTGIIVFCDSLYRNNYLVVEHPEADEPLFYESSISKILLLKAMI